MKEIWDVYDINRQLTDQKAIRGEHMDKGQYHLVIHVCFFNHKKMLIQRRALTKTPWAGLWDISVGGAARSGETSQMAAKRESYEELGIIHDFKNILPQLTVTFERGFDDIYIIEKDISIDDVSFTDGEACEAKWATEEEIVELIKKGMFVPIHQTPYIKYLFFLNQK